MSSVFRKGIRFVGTAIQFGCVAHCLLEFVGDFVLCSGLSMEPTIFSGDIILTEHITPTLQSYQRGDIIIARSPVNPRQYICKRVVGLPGDKMKGATTVPKGHVWLAGDNVNNSMDSWTYGAVPQALVRGRAICKVWPPSNSQMLSDRWLP